LDSGNALDMPKQEQCTERWSSHWQIAQSVVVVLEQGTLDYPPHVP
jgi:hypothetical protein